MSDPKSKDSHSHWETRDGDKVHGEYSLNEADGTKRIVRYSSDKKTGFTAHVEKIGTATHGGHGGGGGHGGEQCNKLLLLNELNVYINRTWRSWRFRWTRRTWRYIDPLYVDFQIINFKSMQVVAMEDMKVDITKKLISATTKKSSQNMFLNIN